MLWNQNSKTSYPSLGEFKFPKLKQIKMNSSISRIIIINGILLSISLKFLVVIRKM